MRIVMVCLGNICRSPMAEAVAGALQLGTDLGSLVSYDHRMLDAAHHLGMSIASPK